MAFVLTSQDRRGRGFMTSWQKYRVGFCVWVSRKCHLSLSFACIFLISSLPIRSWVGRLYWRTLLIQQGGRYTCHVYTLDKIKQSELAWQRKNAGFEAHRSGLCTWSIALLCGPMPARWSLWVTVRVWYKHHYLLDTWLGKMRQPWNAKCLGAWLILINVNNLLFPSPKSSFSYVLNLLPECESGLFNIYY